MHTYIQYSFILLDICGWNFVLEVEAVCMYIVHKLLPMVYSNNKPYTKDALSLQEFIPLATSK